MYLKVQRCKKNRQPVISVQINPDFLLGSLNSCLMLPFKAAIGSKIIPASNNRQVPSTSGAIFDSLARLEACESEKSANRYRNRFMNKSDFYCAAQSKKILLFFSNLA